MELPNCEVIVYCLTYNHEKYIRKTLEGFISQKTTFPFCVIVHDDASTDSTNSIIQEYANKYPSLIFVISQKENQYSQGISIFNTFIIPLINSKYLAGCEGDDYWCSPDKLQKQYDYMERNPECSLCVHNSRIILEDGQLTDRWFNYSTSERDYSVDEVIRAKGGGLFHTSSFFYRAENAIIPKDYIIKGIGDYNLAIYMASIGYVHYIPNVMSYYRTGSINSWVKYTHAEVNRIVAFNMRLIEGLQRIGKVLGSKHNRAIQYAINQYSLDNYLYTHSKYVLLISPKFWISSLLRIIKDHRRKYQRIFFLRRMT